MAEIIAFCETEIPQLTTNVHSVFPEAYAEMDLRWLVPPNATYSVKLISN